MKLAKIEWNRLAAALELGTVSGIRLAARGSTHDVYRFEGRDQAYALRIPRTLQLAKHARFSLAKAALWESVSRNGVGPRYFGTHQVAAGRARVAVSVSEWLEGRPFDPVKDAALLGETLAHLHSRTFSNRDANVKRVDLAVFLKRWLNRQRRLLPQTELGAWLRERLRDQLACRAMQSTRHSRGHCLVHNDLVSQNMVVSQGELRLIDWDWAMWTNPAMDLFCYLSPFVRSWEQPFSLPQSVVTRFLRSYLASADPRVVDSARSGLGLWEAYNAGAAGWLHAAAPLRRRHFASLSFHRWAFAEADRAGESLGRVLSGEKPC